MRYIIYFVFFEHSKLLDSVDQRPRTRYKFDIRVGQRAKHLKFHILSLQDQPSELLLKAVDNLADETQGSLQHDWTRTQYRLINDLVHELEKINRTYMRKKLPCDTQTVSFSLEYSFVILFKTSKIKGIMFEKVLEKKVDIRSLMLLFSL